MNETIRKATWLELFYDLIFVVAIAKAVHTLGHTHHGHIEFETYFKYVLIMIPLWWAWKYTVLYLGIIVDVLFPLVVRRHLARAPVESHHMPERYALLTIILLGESVANLVAAFESVTVSVQSVAAAVAGFLLIAAIWWIYYDNLERRIYGRALGTGQAVIYLHLAIFIGLGGIATMIRFAIDPVLDVADYKLLVGLSTAVLLIALQLLLQIYHPKAERGPLLHNALITFVLTAAALVLVPTNLAMLVAMTGIFVIYAVVDARRQRAMAARVDLSADKSLR